MHFEVVAHWPVVGAWDDLATVDRTVAQATPERMEAHRRNPIVLENLEAVAATGITSGELLDYGCGAGVYRSLLPQKMRYTGADASAPLVEHNRRVDREGRYVVTPALPLPFEDRAFDLVFASGTLHVLEDWRAAVAELARVARGAVVLGRVPVVRRSPSRIVVQHFGRELHPMHVLNRDELAGALAASGLVVGRWDYTSEIFDVGLGELVVMNTLIATQQAAEASREAGSRPATAPR